MNRDMLSQFWDHFRKCHGIAMRVMEAWPEDKLDSQPIPNMRTPKELVAHTYSLIKIVGEGVEQGEIKAPDSEKDTAASFKNRRDLLDYARHCWNAADAAVAKINDQHLQGSVKTPWDMEVPGYFGFLIAQDEFLHHRGQMFTYLRALGGEPPVMWDFGNNAPEYRPKEEAQA